MNTSVTVSPGEKAREVSPRSEIGRWFATPMWLFVRAMGNGSRIKFDDLSWPRHRGSSVVASTAFAIFSWFLLPVTVPLAAIFALRHQESQS